MIRHNLLNWVAGDDWRYFIRLTDSNDEPYNLDTLSEIRWLLHNPFGEIVEHKYLIRPLDVADGRISIWIPHDATTHFVGGVWTDWVRIVCGPSPGIVSTLLTGPISVIADPWRANVAAAPFVVTHRSEANVVIALNQQERIIHEPKDQDNIAVQTLRRGASSNVYQYFKPRLARNGSGH